MICPVTILRLRLQWDQRNRIGPMLGPAFACLETQTAFDERETKHTEAWQHDCSGHRRDDERDEEEVCQMLRDKLHVQTRDRVHN